jgi:23S rRNA pseudouridine1911/1915/1917 synthase
MSSQASPVACSSAACDTSRVSEEALSFTVADDDAGARLDVVLVRRIPGLSRAKARTLTEEGSVRVNGRRARKGAVVASGDVVTLSSPPPPASSPALPDASLALRVLHEDAHLVVVDKDAGVPSHPLRPDERGTVANALVARYPEMAAVGYGPREPGLVHRLDTDTSGVLLAARDGAAFATLRDALRSGAIAKRYVALVEGALVAPTTFAYPLATHPRDPRRVFACVEERDAVRLHARDATTHVVEAEPLGAFTRVCIEAPVAGRHQIRAHLAAAGHPLAGDRLYGGPAVLGLSRHFLHAASLRFTHPASGAAMHVEAPLPADLEAALRTARNF